MLQVFTNYRGHSDACGPSVSVTFSGGLAFIICKGQHCVHTDPCIACFLHLNVLTYVIA